MDILQKENKPSLYLPPSSPPSSPSTQYGRRSHQPYGSGGGKFKKLNKKSKKHTKKHTKK